MLIHYRITSCYFHPVCTSDPLSQSYPKGLFPFEIQPFELKLTAKQFVSFQVSVHENNTIDHITSYKILKFTQISFSD